MESQVQTETTFYRDSVVLVTQSRFVTNSKTYAMRNISSVHIYEIVKSRKLPAILAVIGLVIMLGSGAHVAGGVMMAIGIGLYFAIKNEYSVRISTNSGEANSIISKDKIYIEKIVNALNEAIIHRG